MWKKIDLNTWIVIAGLVLSFVASASVRDYRINLMEKQQEGLQSSIQALTTEVSALKVEIASLRSYYQGREGLTPKQ